MIANGKRKELDHITTVHAEAHGESILDEIFKKLPSRAPAGRTVLQCIKKRREVWACLDDLVSARLYELHCILYAFLTERTMVIRVVFAGDALKKFVRIWRKCARNQQPIAIELLMDASKRICNGIRRHDDWQELRGPTPLALSFKQFRKVICHKGGHSTNIRTALKEKLLYLQVLRAVYARYALSYRRFSAFPCSPARRKICERKRDDTECRLYQQ